MRLIFILCKTNYRKNNLNNFSKILYLKKYLLITLSGPFYFLGLLLMSMNLFKFISIDADPIINSNKGINFWLTGTIHKIPKNFTQLKNNFVNMKSIFHDGDKIFQVYPIIRKKIFFKKKTQIVYFSNCKIKRPELSSEIIKKFKKETKTNLLLFDNKNFWHTKYFNNKNEIDKFLIYRDLKINQRVYLVKEIMSEFSKQFSLFGDEWKTHFPNSHKTTMKKNKIQDTYEGNICLDFGSASGSLSLYPRSIEIIESGGYLMQLKQSDSKKNI